jgi:hypothetical protein
VTGNLHPNEAVLKRTLLTTSGCGVKNKWKRDAALIKKITQFLRKVLPATTASTQQQLVPVEIETKQLESPSFSGTPDPVPTAAASGEPMQPPERRRRSIVKEEDAVYFTKRKFCDTASPYLVPYIYDMKFLHKQCGFRKIGD